MLALSVHLHPRPMLQGRTPTVWQKPAENKGATSAALPSALLRTSHPHLELALLAGQDHPWHAQVMSHE